MLANDTIAVPVGERFVLRAPHIDYFQVKDFPEEGVKLTLEDDVHRTIVYTTSALLGVKALAQPLTELKDGQQVLLYDVASNAPRRAGFRNVSPSSGQVLQHMLSFRAPSSGATSSTSGATPMADPYFVWQLRKSGSQWQLFHPATQRFLPLLEAGADVTLATEGGQFRILPNADGETWKVQGSNGIYWDGKDGAMTGWHTYGHPYRFYRFVAAPYFRIKVHYVDVAGKVLLPTEEHIVPAGSHIEVLPLSMKDYQWKETTTTLKDVHKADAHGDIRVVYDHVTGIHGVNIGSNTSGLPKGTATSTRTYDLQGRESQPHHVGVYVKGGKKVLVRSKAQ